MEIPEGRRTLDSHKADRLRSLIVAAAEGKPEALAELLQSLQDTIYRFCVSRLGDENSARDATQEVGMRLIKGVRTYRGAAAVKTWALGVAVNVCREQQRGQKGNPTEPQLLDTRISDSEGPAARAVTLESAQLVRGFVQELPPRQSEAVTLRYFEQLSIADAAEAMGCSEGTVKAAVWLGLRSLRNKLEGM